MAVIRAVCISKEKGVEKQNVGRALLRADWGLEGDAHAGSPHRQMSLLDAGKIAAFNERGAGVAYGAFGENIVADLDFRALPVGTLLRCGEALLELTQLGKECHHGCAIRQRMGDCIMPREGVFARVLEGGAAAVGDPIHVEPRVGRRPYHAAVITLSDRCARGEREDKSGPAIVERLQRAGYTIVQTLLLPDGEAPLRGALIRLAGQQGLDLILTTGGTGVSPRDLTPEATLAVGERVVPGVAEAMRAHSLGITPRAMLSRGVCVIRGRTLILNLPGSVKAANESLDAVIDTLPHALDLLRGEAGDCAR